MSSYPPDGVPDPGSGAAMTDPETVTPVYDMTRTESTGAESGMGDTAFPSGAGMGQPSPSADATTNGGKAQAQNVASDAKDAAQHVAGASKEQAKKVVGDAAGQAKQLLQQTRTELQDQAATQQKRVADGLRSLGDELGSMVDNEGSTGLASELVRNIADRTGSVAGWLDERDPGSLLGEVKSFAARRPGTFIAIAVGSGLLAGRLARSLVSTSKDESLPGEP